MDKIDAVGNSVDALIGRVAAVEQKVDTVMCKALRHDTILGWIKLGAVLLVGIGIGLGIITVSDVISIAK